MFCIAWSRPQAGLGISRHKYKEYKKSRKKPSDFCKEDLRMADVKSYRFVKSYFADPMVLVAAIKKTS